MREGSSRRAARTRSTLKLIALLAGALLPCAAAWAQTQAPDPATGLAMLDVVRRTLALNTNIHLQQQQIEAAGGRLQQASGQFDTVLGATVSTGVDRTPLSDRDQASNGNVVDKSINETQSVGVNANKQFRSGISIGPSATITRSQNNINSMFFGDAPQNRNQVNFQITVPLQRGLGVEATGANERAAAIALDATKADLRHTVAQSVFNSVTQYWSYLAAANNLEIARRAEGSVNRLVEEVQKLIGADELPAAELNLVRANAADKAAQRAAAEQALVDARSALGRAIGLNAAQTAALPLPATGFPAVEEEILRISQEVDRLHQQALIRRADFASARTREESALALVAGARNQLKPQLDLNLAVGYSTLREGSRLQDFRLGLDQNLTGPNATVTLRYLFPPANNTAAGILLQQSAAYDQATINARDLRNSILINVQTVAEALRHGAEQLRLAEASVRLYETTVSNEEVKRRLAVATLIDVINVGDRLLNALLNRNSQYFTYANNLARLRFETGTIVEPSPAGPEHYAVDLSTLTTVPH
jgi:outer membrane protein TolC